VCSCATPISSCCTPSARSDGSPTWSSARMTSGRRTAAGRTRR
jgi:hypothetical protein